MDQALVVFDDTFVRFHRCNLGGQLLLWNRVLLEKRLITCLVDAGIVQSRLVASQLSFILRQLGFIWTRVNLGQRIAFMYDVALFVVDFHELARYLSLDGDGVNGCHGAEPGNIYANISFYGFGGIHWRCTGVRALSLAAACCAICRPGRSRRFLRPIVIAARAQQRQYENPNPETVPRWRSGARRPLFSRCLRRGERWRDGGHRFRCYRRASLLVHLFPYPSCR